MNVIKKKNALWFSSKFVEKVHDFLGKESENNGYNTGADDSEKMEVTPAQDHSIIREKYEKGNYLNKSIKVQNLKVTKSINEVVKEY